MVTLVHEYSQGLTKIFNDYVKKGNFPDILKYADITPVFFKKVIQQAKVTKGLLVHFLISQKFLKNCFILISFFLWSPNFPNI